MRQGRADGRLLNFSRQERLRPGEMGREQKELDEENCRYVFKRRNDELAMGRGLENTQDPLRFLASALEFIH